MGFCVGTGLRPVQAERSSARLCGAGAPARVSDCGAAQQVFGRAAEGKMPSGQPAGRRRYQTRSSKRSSARLYGAGAPARVADCGAVTMCPTAAEGKMPSGQPAGRRRYKTRSAGRAPRAYVGGFVC